MIYDKYSYIMEHFLIDNLDKIDDKIAYEYSFTW